MKMQTLGGADELSNGAEEMLLRWSPRGLANGNLVCLILINLTNDSLYVIFSCISANEFDSR